MLVVAGRSEVMEAGGLMIGGAIVGGPVVVEGGGPLDSFFIFFPVSWVKNSFSTLG